MRNVWKDDHYQAAVIIALLRRTFVELLREAQARDREAYMVTEDYGGLAQGRKEKEVFGLVCAAPRSIHNRSYLRFPLAHDSTASVAARSRTKDIVLLSIL